MFSMVNLVQVMWWSLLAAFLSFSIAAAPYDTSINYSGRLTDEQNVANGNYQMRFCLFDTPTDGIPIAKVLTNTVTVSEGLFTVALDFGSDAFPGQDRWLEIGIRPEGSSSSFIILSPRQRVRFVPYSVHSLRAEQVSELSPEQVGSSLAQMPVVPDAQLRQSDSLLAVTQPGTSEAAVHSILLESVGAALFGTGNTLYVDAVRGNDQTAQRGNPTRPWATISNAVAAVQDGDTVLIQPGKYHLKGGRPLYHAAINLSGRSGVSILGVGMPVLSWTNYGDGLVIEGCNNVRVSGLRFEAVRFDGSIASNGLSGAIVMRQNSRNISIDHCQFINLPDHGITCGAYRDSTNVTISYCYFNKIGFTNHVPKLEGDGAGISGVGSHWIISHNIFEQCRWGVEIENIDPHQQPLSDILVEGNKFYNTWNISIIILQGTTNTISDVSIIGNEHNDPAMLYGELSYFLVSYGGNRIQVSNNRIQCKGGVAIGLTSYNQKLADCMISGNFIQGPAYYAIAVEESPGEQMCTNILVAGNYCLGQRYAGILVAARGCHIANNYIIGSGFADPNYGGGIILRTINAAPNHTLFNNLIKVHPSCKYGIFMYDQSVTNNHIVGNLILGQNQMPIFTTAPRRNNIGLNHVTTGQIYGTNNVRMTSTDYQMSRNDNVVLSTGKIVKITLPDTRQTSQMFIIKQSEDGTTRIVPANTLQTLNGQAEYKLLSKGRAVALQSDGTKWHILWTQ